MKTRNTKNNCTVSCILGGRSKVFLVSGNGKIILTDTGAPACRDKLLNNLNKNNIKNIDYLILTHSHYDHAGNAAMLRKEFGTKVIINKNEVSFLEKGENIVPQGTIILTRMLVKTLGQVYLSRAKYEPCIPDIITDEYFNLNNIGINGYLIHTPGHSPGSQSVIIDDEIALVGDAMFGIFPGSVFPPFADNTADLIKSWAKLLDTKCNEFHPSHGSMNTRSLLDKEYIRKKSE
jgi:hydroxyacylglutathione hydrolase